VVFFGVVGGDDFGERALASLRALGISTEGVLVNRALRTGLTISIAMEGDRAMLTYPGCISQLRYEHIDFERLRECSHVHIGGFFLQEQLQADCGRIFARAKALGLTTSLDTGWDIKEGWDGGLQDALAHTDVFLPNEYEVIRIAGSKTLDEALEALPPRPPLIVVKLGARGALACQHGERIPRSAFAIDPVDTTGAGDSFNAGFLHAWLHGTSLAEALDLGNATGALSTRAAGGTASQPTLEEALAWMAVARRRESESEP